MWHGEMRRVWLTGVVWALVAAVFCGCKGPGSAESRPSGGTSRSGGGVAEAGAGGRGGVSAGVASEGVLAAVEAMIDFGEAGPKEKLQGEFRLVNRGSKSLKIKRRIGKSCGCVAEVKLGQYELAPGEETTLSFVYTTKSTSGPVSQSLKVYPERPAGPGPLVLRIKTTIRELVTVEPSRVRFEMRAGAQPEATVTVKSVGGEAFAITGAKPPAGVKVDFSGGQQASHQVRLTAEAEGMGDAKRGYVMLKLDHAKVDAVTVGYEVVNRFSVRPGTRAFLGLKEGKVSRAHVVVLSNFGETFSLGDLKTEKGLARVLEVKKRGDGYQIELEMERPAEVTGGYIDDYLTVPIVGTGQTLRVHCYGVLK